MRRTSRNSHRDAFLIVEGKDDIRFWRPRCHANCSLIDGEGKRNVVGTVRHLDAVRFAGAVGIVDSDFERFINGRFESRNLLYTDAHDLECLLCRSSALDKVLAEHGDPAKIDRFESAGIDVRSALLERALVFGKLRWAAVHESPVIELRGMAVQRFLDEDTWLIDDRTLMLETAPNFAGAHVLRRRLAQLPEADPWYVANGHDMVEILRTGLRRVLGDLPARITSREIAALLRAGMSPEDLRDTELWTDMQAWQAANPPYAVLAD